METVKDKLKDWGCEAPDDKIEELVDSIKKLNKVCFQIITIEFPDYMEGLAGSPFLIKDRGSWLLCQWVEEDEAFKYMKLPTKSNSVEDMDLETQMLMIKTQGI